jgi:hypothetical protein
VEPCGQSLCRGGRSFQPDAAQQQRELYPRRWCEQQPEWRKRELALARTEDALMLDFPSNPNLNDVFDRWRWDGARWVCGPPEEGEGGEAFPGVYVGPTAPPGAVEGFIWFNTSTQQMFVYAGGQWTLANSWTQPGAQFGVVDGSNAAPGWIGEYIITGASTANLNNTNITLMNLQPGDWDVSGHFRVYMPGSAGSAATMILLPPLDWGAGPFVHSIVGIGNIFQEIGLALPPTRVNISYPSPIVVTLSTTPANGSCLWRAVARRMR